MLLEMPLEIIDALVVVALVAWQPLDILGAALAAALARAARDVRARRR